MSTINLTIVAQEQVCEIQVEIDETVENLKALLQVQMGIPLDEQKILFQGKELSNNVTLRQAGISQNDLIQLERQASIPNAQHSISLSKASEFINYIQANPQLLQQINQVNPVLAEAVKEQNLEKVAILIQEEESRRRKKEEEHQRRIDLLNQDPFNPEAQRLIAEEIRLQNIEENLHHAFEHTPESFTRVTMLYIDLKVNNTPVKAFVDSGAQQTIMSAACAQRCGIERLIDKRYSGIAKGVGQAPILGRVHLAQIQIGSSFFPCSFTILQDDSVEFLLGLDMLRRHQCSIDLKKNCLDIGDEKVPFLSEKDIPKNTFFNQDNQPTSTTSQPPSTSSNLNKPSVSSQPFPEETIQQLMNFGFSREKVIAALKLCNGNGDAAAAYLFSE